MAYHNLTEHFRSFFRRLNPGSSFESRASSHYNTIKSLIEDRNGSSSELAPQCFLQGSYRQSTAIHSINDIDIVALCRLWYPGSGGIGSQSYNRDRIFEVIAAPLLRDQRYAGKVRYGPGSMCIKVDLGIKVEILPVVFKSGTTDPGVEPFVLFRPSTGNWDDGYARYHQSLLSVKNANASSNFIPAIKILKHCRTLMGAEAVSFHLECLLYSVPDHFFASGPADYITNILAYLSTETADAWYRRRMPTVMGERDIFTTAEWPPDKWATFHNLLRKWAHIAAMANSEASMNKAISWWQLLLGDDYFPANV